jgi:hypothetical protein
MTMPLIPSQEVPAPVPGPRRYGLFDAASGPVDLAGNARGAGVRYRPVTCGSARSWPLGCYAGSVVPPEGGKEGLALAPEVNAIPFLVMAGQTCSRVGYTSGEFDAMIRAELEAGEQGAAEAALWTGLDGDGTGLGITSLATDPFDITITDGDSITEVVAALEDYAYRAQGYAYRAMIHAPVSVAAWAAEVGLIEKDGRLKVTPYGSVWVFGGGYPGGPDSAATLHITGQVSVWRSAETFVYPVDETMDRATNEVLLVAEREYAIGFDCLNGRATFDPLGVSSP